MESISFVPSVMPAEGGMDFVGRMPAGGAIGASAQLRHDTHCAVCGKGFAKGQIVDVRLAADPDDALFAHRECGLPPLPVDMSASRYRGIEMRRDPNQLSIES